MSRKDDLLGATGHFPQGKLGPHDEGELRFAVGRTPDGKIILDFNTPVKWLGLTQEGAIEMAKRLAAAAGAKKITIEL